jgi:hypothetical protein
MSEKQVQVNIRIAETSADRLKRFAESAGLKIGAFVERLIAGYRDDSNLLENDSKPVLWQSAVEELRGLIDSQDVRLCAIETAIMSGLDAGSGKVRVSVQAAEKEAAGTDNDASSHPAESLPLPPQQFNQDKDQFRTEAVNLYRQGVIGSPDILRILNERGFRNSKGNEYYRNDVRNALKEAGLVE